MLTSNADNNAALKSALPIILVVLTAAEIVSDLTGNLWGVYVNKPLLMPLLMLMLLVEQVPLNKLGKFVLVGLVCSTFGDVFLMFRSQDLFIPGLASFLIAHIWYIFGFRATSGANTNQPKGYRLTVVTLMLLFLAGFLWLLLDAMLATADKMPFVFPVIIYALVIVTMGMVMAMRRGLVATASFRYGLIGAISFIVSDSILATNLFVTEVPWASLWVMSTYVLAQFCLVRAAIESR